MTEVQAETKFLFVYNPGPGTLAYISPRPGEVADLILSPWVHTPVDRAYLDQPYFRRDMKAKRFSAVEAADMPVSDSRQISPDYYDKLDAAQRQFVVRLCSEPFSDQFRDAVHVGNHISPSGIPARDTRVTVLYLKETHQLVLKAALDLEKRWQKRRAVISEIVKALKRIEAL